MERDELRCGHGDPGNRDDDARPALGIAPRHDSDHFGERHGGKRTDLRCDPAVKSQTDRPDAEPPEGARARLLREAPTGSLLFWATFLYAPWKV